MPNSEYVTIDLTSGNARAVPIQLPEFPTNIVLQFSKLLQCDVVSNGSLDLALRTVAFSYQAQKNNTRETERGAKRSRQCKAATAVNKALEAIDQLQTGDIVPFVEEGGDDAYKKLRALSRLLEHWSPIMSKFAKRRLPRGREESILLNNVCGHLKMIFEEYSGQLATQTTWKNTEYTGLPTSLFGLFVTVFFDHVDKQVHPRHLVEPLKKAVWRRRKSK